jgi:hypothetical protein
MTFPFASLSEIVEADTTKGAPALIDVRLPTSEAGSLLRLLSLDGLDAACVFPGYDGVKRAVEDREHWPSAK